MRLYLNGVEVASRQYTGPLTVNSNPILIGKSGFGEYVHGIVDDVRMYNRAISGTEVQALVAGPNTPPTANAGLDQTVHVGSVVTLDGSGSSDPDGNVPLTYAWSFVSRPTGSSSLLSDMTIANPTFTPDLPGNYTVQLIVTDRLGATSAPDTVTISTTNSAPVADAGLDQSIIVIGTVVRFDGTTSFDLDGTLSHINGRLSPDLLEALQPLSGRIPLRQHLWQTYMGTM